MILSQKILLLSIAVIKSIYVHFSKNLRSQLLQDTCAQKLLLVGIQFFNNLPIYRDQYIAAIFSSKICCARIFARASHSNAFSI